MKYTFFMFLILIFNSVAVHSRIHQFQTTRLKSTAGTGVGSILMDESTILNPAPIAFIKSSSLYFQKSGGDINGTPSPMGTPKYKYDQIGIIASDSSNKISGSLGYFSQKEKHSSRQQISLSAASTVGKTSALGFTSKLTKDELSVDGFNKSKKNQTQIIAGVIHVVNKDLTLGIIVHDILKKVKNDTYGMIGSQYVVKDFLSLMYDVGADYSKTLSDGLIQRGALQMKILKDFYLRAGVFSDKRISEKGNGLGIGWVQPRLVIDIAFQNITIMENKLLAQINEEIKETSFSLSYKF